jgi:hypothetical protein
VSEPALLEPPPRVTPAPPGSPALAELVLLRLLPEKKSVPPKKLRADLAVFFRRSPAAEEVADAVAALKAEGFIGPKGQRATDAGRARALQFLGVERLPPRANWRTVKARYLVPQALGLPPDSAEYAKADTGEKLAALLLKRDLNLPNAGHTMTAVVDALLCRALGHPGFTDLNALICAKLGEAIGGDPIGKADAKKILPRVRLNVTGVRAEQLYAAVLGGRFTGGSAAQKPAEVEEVFDLEAFANTVKAIARTCPTGRFGGNKVFISHLPERNTPRTRAPRVARDCSPSDSLQALGFLRSVRSGCVEMLLTGSLFESISGARDEPSSNFSRSRAVNCRVGSSVAQN